MPAVCCVKNTIKCSLLSRIMLENITFIFRLFLSELRGIHKFYNEKVNFHLDVFIKEIGSLSKGRYYT